MMREDAVGRGEVDYRVGVPKLFGRERGAGGVFSGAATWMWCLRAVATSATSDPVLPRPRRSRFMGSANI